MNHYLLQRVAQTGLSLRAVTHNTCMLDFPLMLRVKLIELQQTSLLRATSDSKLNDSNDGVPGVLVRPCLRRLVLYTV